MNYCGLDLSLSGTGVIVINPKEKILVNALISTKPSLSTEKRIRHIWKYINGILNQYKKVSINIEGLAFSLRGQRALELAGLHYYIRTNLTVRNVPPVIITPPTTLKKFVTGKGNCKKNLMLLAVYQKWGQSFSNDNIADAYSLAQFLRHLNTDNK